MSAIRRVLGGVLGALFIGAGGTAAPPSDEQLLKQAQVGDDGDNGARGRISEQISIEFAAREFEKELTYLSFVVRHHAFHAFVVGVCEGEHARAFRVQSSSRSRLESAAEPPRAVSVGAERKMEH